MPQPRRSSNSTSRRSSSSSSSRRSTSSSARRDTQPRPQINTEDIAQLEAGRSLVIGQLEEAHATEAALITTLGAHISMTPEGSYRKILERHVDETKAQAQAIQERLGELGANQGLLSLSFGTVQTLVGQALAIGKGPIDLLRGRAGEEKLFKNAKDECATEILEIATYDGLEATALAVGDTKTAKLAARHRAQEERMLSDLRAELPKLANALVRAVAAGDASYDPSTTGAAEGLRGVRDEVVDEAEELRDEATDAAGEIAERGRAAGKAAGKRFQRAAQGPSNGDLPIANYDKLTASEVNQRLSRLSADQLRTVEAYERRNRNRQTVLNRIDTAKSSS
ncbi:MAG: DUF892 family protein [Actinomycetota bacterium]|nr:DUF892 family protein [Actinomycetota bacterium]